MKILFWIGLAVMVLGLVSLVIPIPAERAGVNAVGVSAGIEVRRERRLSPAVSGIMIFGGAALLIAGKRKT
jgi:hypothetical protein